MLRVGYDGECLNKLYSACSGPGMTGYANGQTVFGMLRVGYDGECLTKLYSACSGPGMTGYA